MDDSTKTERVPIEKLDKFDGGAWLLYRNEHKHEFVEMDRYCKMYLLEFAEGSSLQACMLLDVIYTVMWWDDEGNIQRLCSHDVVALINEVSK